MAITALQAAYEICKRGDWGVTNLQLHKILYIAHMMYMGKTDTSLIRESFEAWDYGPVVPSLYHKLKMYGARPINYGFYGVNSLSDDKDRYANELEVLHATTDFALTKTPGQLVGFTHRKNGAWDNSYISGVMGIPISNDDIVKEYKDIIKKIDA